MNTLFDTSRKCVTFPTYLLVSNFSINFLEIDHLRECKDWDIIKGWLVKKGKMTVLLIVGSKCVLAFKCCQQPRSYLETDTEDVEDLVSSLLN